MKLLLTVLFLMSSVLSAPQPCPHAMGAMEKAEAETHAAMAAHDRIDHEMHGDEPPCEHTDHKGDCADDCDGGADCASCFALTSIVAPIASIFLPDTPHTDEQLYLAFAVTHTPSVDGPPPRSV
ncbi:MAG: hypothetical protein AAGH41_02735 [Pseudomonadota bacterium]